MFAFIPQMFPLVPVILGAGAVTVTACSSMKSGKKRAKIAALKARIEAPERKP
jgi:hypothetical protein